MARAARHSTGTRGARRAGVLAVLLSGALLGGCTAWVSDVTLSESADYLWLVSTTSDPRERFAADEPQVTLSVTFTPNLFASFKSFRVDWIDPENHFHERHYIRTQWGSHRHVIASMPLAGTAAAHKLGRWRVELWYRDQLLAQRPFEVVPAGADTGSEAG